MSKRPAEARPLSTARIACRPLARKSRFEKGRDKTRHRRGKVVRSPHQMDCGEFGLVLAGKSGLDPRAQWFAAHIDVQEADHRNRRAHHHAVPMWLRRIVLLDETSLLENLADDAASDVNRAVPD